MAKISDVRSPPWPVLGLGLGIRVRGGDNKECEVRVQVGSRHRVGVKDGIRCR